MRTAFVALMFASALAYTAGPAAAQPAPLNEVGVTINNSPVTIVGVLPAGIQFPFMQPALSVS